MTARAAKYLHSTACWCKRPVSQVPAPVLLTAAAEERLSEVFHVERVITTADAVHGFSQLRANRRPQGGLRRRRALADEYGYCRRCPVGALRARLHGLNPVATAWDVVHPAIDPDILFNSHSRAPRAPAISATCSRRWRVRTKLGLAIATPPETMTASVCSRLSSRTRSLSMACKSGWAFSAR